MQRVREMLESGPVDAHMVAERTHCDVRNARLYLGDLHQDGVIFIKRWARSIGHGPFYPVFMLMVEGAKDAVKPPTRNKSVVARLRRQKIRKQLEPEKRKAREALDSVKRRGGLAGIDPLLNALMFNGKSAAL